MLTEDFVSSICGPPLSANTAVAKDVGIYCHGMRPTYSVKATFKKTSVPVHCLAVSDSHVFAAQHEKAYVHVYSRLRGNQEAFVSLPERIRSVALAGDVLVMGTAEGRLMLWEICTGRLTSTPPRHVQAVTCLATAPWHVVSGSDDSDLHVWSLSRLLELDSAAEHEPDRSLSNHRAAVTALVCNQSINPDTSICVSASKDRSCIVWNYLTGHVLRTLLFPSSPSSLALDAATRALFVSSDDGSVYLVEFFAERPLLGPGAPDASTPSQVSAPFGVVPADAGPPSCLALSYDGTVLLTGHATGQILRWDVAENRTPAVLANLNAAVTNLIFVPPLAGSKPTQALTVVKPVQVGKSYGFTAQLDTKLCAETRLDSMLAATGFDRDQLEAAISEFQRPSGDGAGEQELAQQNNELWELVHEQRALQRETLERYMQAKSVPL